VPGTGLTGPASAGIIRRSERVLPAARRIVNFKHDCRLALGIRIMEVGNVGGENPHAPTRSTRNPHHDPLHTTWHPGAGAPLQIDLC